ncbi:MAG TPA: TIGR02281 family clan AA aspartic protease [Ramlibacter sp.]|nr:TIGR02281 family clan AA aspartic protease [Ramlibacter sp.]
MDSNARPSAANLPKSLRWGHMGILAFWLALMGLLYAGLSISMQPKEVTITADGDLVIPRHRDGHFYVEGKVHGKPILFMVDTGATSVVVSEAFARRAGLPQGQPTTFMTANGTLQGTTVRGIQVEAGPFSVSSVNVGVGLVGGDADQGLLGQSFLSRFDVTISKKELVLRRPR